MSKFVMQSEMTTDHVDWGTIGWRTRPENTACKTFVVMDVGLEPGFGHDFHKHPQQDELITVLAGTHRAVDRRREAILEVGDSVYLDKDVVHASFNVGDVPRACSWCSRRASATRATSSSTSRRRSPGPPALR